MRVSVLICCKASSEPSALPVPHWFLWAAPLRRAKSHRSQSSGPARGSSCGCGHSAAAMMLLLCNAGVVGDCCCSCCTASPLSSAVATLSSVCVYLAVAHPWYYPGIVCRAGCTATGRSSSQTGCAFQLGFCPAQQALSHHLHGGHAVFIEIVVIGGPVERYNIVRSMQLLLHLPAHNAYACVAASAQRIQMLSNRALVFVIHECKVMPRREIAS